MQEYDRNENFSQPEKFNWPEHAVSHRCWITWVALYFVSFSLTNLLFQKRTWCPSNSLEISCSIFFYFSWSVLLYAWWVILYCIWILILLYIVDYKSVSLCVEKLFLYFCIGCNLNLWVMCESCLVFFSNFIHTASSDSVIIRNCVMRMNRFKCLGCLGNSDVGRRLIDPVTLGEGSGNQHGEAETRHCGVWGHQSGADEGTGAETCWEEPTTQPEGPTDRPHPLPRQRPFRSEFQWWQSDLTSWHYLLCRAAVVGNILYLLEWE